MEWDDELESLTLAVEQLGHDVLTAAVDRVLTEAEQDAEPVLPQSPLGLAPFAGGVTDGNVVIRAGVFEDALKTELRRLLQPH